MSPTSPFNVLDLISTGDQPTLWIFGYGSLIWNPGFGYESSIGGYAPGYVRRFYQGNSHARGSKLMPGRVVTLLKSDTPTNVVCGLLFCVRGLKSIAFALRHLYEREIDHGYVFSSIDVHIQPTVDDCPSMISAASTVVSALTCIAYENNRYYLGAGISDRQMADEIRRARGHAGPNCEYLFRLADGVRKHFPDYYDEHLFALERYVLDNDDARCYSEKTNEHNAVSIVSLRKKNEGDESASTPSVRWRHQHNLSIRFVE